MSMKGTARGLVKRVAPRTYERLMDRYVLRGWERRNAVRVSALAASEPDAGAAPVVGALRRDGIAVTGFADVFEGGASLAADATERAHALWTGYRSGEASQAQGEVEEGKEFKVHLLPDVLGASDPFLRMALDPRMLDIAGRHLGMVPYLRVIDLWWDRPTDEPAKETQLWHRDYDDVKIVKAFVYLNDVDEQAGPFSFIPATHFAGRAAPLRAQIGKRRRTTDTDMEALVPRSSWRVCTGPATTTVICDTTGYHKGEKPTAKDRLLLLLEYTSPSTHMARSFRIDGSLDHLSPIQRAALEVNG